MNIQKHVIAIILFVIVANTAPANNSSVLIREIDALIPKREEFTLERKHKIDTLMAILPTLDNDTDRYNVYRSIYGSYRSYRSDSALIIADRRLDIARRLGDINKINSASLNLAEGFSACGNYYGALAILDTLHRSGMEPHHLKYLYSIYGQTYRRLGAADLLDSRKIEFKKLEKAYRDSSLTMFGDGDADYHYLKAWQLMDTGHWNEALKLIEQTEKRFGPIDDNAPILAQKALIYHNLGDGENEKKYLAQAAIIDLKNGVKDYSALMDLAIHLKEEGDVDRAFDYIRCALDDAMFSNAKSRTSEILQAIPIIDAAYAQTEHERKITLWIFCAIAGVLLLGMATALFFVRKQLLKNRRVKNNLALANNRKSEHINELFDDYSSYIEKISAFRKHVSILLKVGKYSEAKNYVDNDKLEADELRELYQKFDEVFLSMHPNFIEEFNTMVKPENRVPVDSGSLTSALRVLALMKIGITSANRIATMLHYTPQTVYNYRNRVRQSLIVDVSEFDRWLEVSNGDLNSENP